ncbi:MAG: glycoside hydrolase family 5 protein [Ruminococcus sp.]|nr:glycoside hydrolase family 5 protein [Ruminococcus sp.]
MRKHASFTSFCAALLAAACCLTACSDSSSSTAETSSGSSSTADSSTSEDESSTADNTTSEGKKTEMHPELTSLELAKLMGNGINLGNTMEAYGHGSYEKGVSDPRTCENNWGQPTTTKEMIAGMKAAGFDSIRIPVAWTNAMAFETGDYTIDELYLDRVEEIINYALDSDMYVIINDHWDGGWWGMFGSATEETRNKAMEMYVSMWTQISNRYAKYGDMLIFEGGNEELGDRLNDKDIAKDSGTLRKNACYEKTNEINQKFVDTVRAAGGNNSERFLLIPGYNTDITCTVDDRFKMPSDSAKNKLLLSVHYYTPWNYCGEKSLTSWGSPTDINTQNDLLKSMTKYTDQGYAIIIGEYAVLTNGHKPKNDTDKFYTNFLNNCDLYGFVPMLWDCNNLFDRNECKITDEGMNKLFADRSLSAQSSLSDDEVKKNAEDGLKKFLDDANAELSKDISVPASDDYSAAWIMYQSGDYSLSYSVGDIYDPSSATAGIKANNVKIEGDGTYEVSLDFTGAGSAKGVAFSALGISNGEKLHPGCIVKIEEIKVNGEPVKLVADGYTSSDDGKCTRVNILNPYMDSVPDNIRTMDGDTSKVSYTIIDPKDFSKVDTLSVKFTFKSGT